MKFAEVVDPVSSFCTLSFYRFPPENALWAMQMMYHARNKLSRTFGITFWKLLGTGKGFGPLKPDLFRYAILAVWKDPDAAQDFFDNNQLIRNYNTRSESNFKIALQSYQSRGSWSGKEPFINNKIKKPDADAPVAILTRGSIKMRKAISFWKHEPDISKEIKSAPGLIASAGLGEYPLLRQVTFSIWESEKAMENFAHKKAHASAAKAAFDNDYFSEWMFTRFKILATEGKWEGKEVLINTRGTD